MNSMNIYIRGSDKKELAKIAHKYGVSISSLLVKSALYLSGKPDDLLSALEGVAHGKKESK